jgi:hypothetical protein
MRWLAALVLLFVMASANPQFASASLEADFNKAFCEDYTWQFAYRNRNLEYNDYIKVCESILANFSLYDAIQKQDSGFCQSIAERKPAAGYDGLFRMDNPRYVEPKYADEDGFIDACKFYLANQTGNFSICNGEHAGDRRYFGSTSDAKCVNRLALSRRNLSILDEYNGMNEPWDRYIGYSAWFKEFDHIDQCRTRWEYPMSLCLLYFSENHPGDKRVCELIKDRRFKEDCLGKYAERIGSLETCLNITNPYTKNPCICSLAKKNVDVDICALIEKTYPNSNEVNNCLNGVPLAPKANQTSRWAFVAAGVLVIPLLGFLLKTGGKHVMARFIILTFAYLGYYASWIFFALGAAGPITRPYNIVHGGLVLFFGPYAMYLGKAVARFAGEGSYVWHFIWTFIEFTFLAVYVVILPEFFTGERNGKKLAIGTGAIILTLAAAAMSILIWITFRY